MSITNKLILPVTMALGLTTMAGWGQQPAPPPAEVQAETGWRKFEGRPAPVAAVVVPATLVAPAGTWITIRVNDVLSTSRNHAGDVFSATLAQPLIVDGIVLARRGQTLAGRVAEVEKGGRVKGTSRLGLEMTELSLADGRQMRVRTQLINYSGGTSMGRDGTAVAATTAAGAAIGGMADGGFGAGVGALAGAAASTIGVLVTRGHATEVYPEALITFRLLEPLTVSTERAVAAFRPAAEGDYETRLEQRPAVRVVQRAPLYLGLGYGYGFPYYYSPFWYGPGFGYYGGSYYRGGYYGGGGHYGGGGRGGRR
ncbi:MAG TPA: hypothetical protein VGK29_13950 [Paludibaculum sp.]